MIQSILTVMKMQRLSADNIAFGMGAELLQKVDRDTQKFAMKASAIRIGDLWMDVWKDPVTDTGKRSKRGRLALVNSSSGLTTVRLEACKPGENLLKPVFRNGRLLVDQSFDQIRHRSDQVAIPVAA